MVEIPDSLVERLKRRQAALVAGLGCGELAGAPGWSALIEWLAARLATEDDRAAVERMVAAGRLADAVAFVRASLPAGALPEALREAYPDGVPVPDALPLAATLPWRAVLTTGFDDLWERAAMAPGTPLLHLFGRAGFPDELRLGPANAHERLAASEGLTCLDDQRRRRSLVLIGFRATDPDLDWLTGWMSLAPTPEVPHFLFLDVSRDTDPGAEARLAALRTGMTVLPCPGGTAEALELLGQLAASVGANLASYDADVDVQDWLRRWAAAPGDPEPREILARAAVALGAEQEWERLIELLLGRFELQSDREEQLATLREAAAIFRGPLASPGRALTTELAALRLDPLNDALWEELRADAGATGAWEELFTDGTEVARAIGPIRESARIWREVAGVALHHLARPDDAAAAYQAALDVEPDDRATRDALGDLLRQLGRWPELIAVLRAGAIGERDARRAATLLLEAAELLEARVADPLTAITVYEGVLAVDPESEPAWAALERLYEGQGRWADLATLLQGLARRLPAAEAAARRHRRANILVDHLGDHAAAAADLEDVIRADPGDRAALELLERIYEQTEHPDDRVRIVARLVDVAPDDTQRLALLRQLAVLWEARPEGLDQAADALEHVLRIAPRDAEAFAALTRVYRAARRLVALADVLERQIDLTAPGEARIALYLSLGQTYDQDLDDAGKAYDAYAAAEASGDRREEVYEILVRLAERRERWSLCAEALLKWADVAPDPEVRAEVLLQAAMVFAEQLHDRAGAETQLDRVLALAPAHAPAMIALARLRREGGDFERAAALLVEAQQQQPEPTARAELLTEAGTILQTELGQEERAAELFGQALGADPDYVPAGERLADLAFQRQRWAEVEPILQMLARKLEGNDAESARLAAVRHRLAQVSLELGQSDQAAAHFAEAERLAPESLPLLTDFATFRERRGEWKAARDLLAAILRVHGTALPAAERLDLTMRVARSEAEQGDALAAIEQYQKAQALDPMHRPAITALAALHEAKEDWPALVRDKRALMAIAAPGEQTELLEEIGDLYLERLNEVLQAETAYRAALKGEPDRRSTLHKLLELYTKEKSWRPAAETLARLAEVEADPTVRAKSLYTAALIRRDELGHMTEAADLLERALDEAPDLIEAFDVLEALHRSQNDWTELARSYRRMIRRLPADGLNELRLRLWSQMGELAQKRLRQPEVALAAFEVTVSLDPDNLRRKEALADLYVQAGPAATDKAIAAHQHLVWRNPDRLASYRALCKLYGETQQFDKHWCVAATLSFLGKADPTLEATVHRYRPPQLRLARRKFNEEVWQRAMHPDEDRLLDGLFVLVGAPLAAPAARTHAAVGLRRKRRADLATDTRMPARALARVAETLDLPTPDLFFVEAEGAETTILNLHEKGVATPALLVGPTTARRSDSFELVFDLSKRLAFLRPERFLRYALATPAALNLALQVALGLGGAASTSAAGAGAEAAEVARLTEYLSRTMAPQTLEQLALLGPKFVAAHGGEAIDFSKWLVATELTAGRVALVVTGDLWAAARVISSEPPGQVSLPVRERLKDLVAFSVSEDYFTCRHLLGLEIG